MTETNPLIPLNDLSRAIIRDTEEIVEATRRVLSSGYVIQGPEHQQFEIELGTYLGVNHVIGVASGTDGLELAIKAAMPAGRNTIVTAANAGGYSTMAALRAGFGVLYADVDDATLCLDDSTVAAVLTPGVGVVVVTHLYGCLTDVTGLLTLCRNRGILIVEDCAQSIGARRGETMAGGFGDLAALSFYPTKNLGALGDGGAVVTNDEQTAVRVRALRQYGWDSKYHVAIHGGVNSRLDELQAAYLRVRLPQLDGLNERRRQIVAHYVDAAAGLEPGLLRVLPARGEHHVAHLAIARSTDRDDVRRQLFDAGVNTDIHFPIPDHQQPGFKINPLPDLPTTMVATREILTLPCFPEMTDDEIDRVCLAIAALRQRVRVVDHIANYS